MQLTRAKTFGHPKKTPATDADYGTFIETAFCTGNHTESHDFECNLE